MADDLKLSVIEAQSRQPVVIVGVTSQLLVTLENHTGGPVGIKSGSKLRLFPPKFYRQNDAFKNMAIALSDWRFERLAGEHALLLTYQGAAKQIPNGESLEFRIDNATASGDPGPDTFQLNPENVEGNVDLSYPCQLDLHAKSSDERPDLKAVLQVSAEDRGVVYSSTKINPIENTITFNIKYTGSTELCSDHAPRNPALSPRIIVSFAYGSTQGALLPVDQAGELPAGIVQGQGWQGPTKHDVKDGPTSYPIWIVEPSDTNLRLLAAGDQANLTVRFSKVVTFNAPGDTQIYVKFRDIPARAGVTYNDADNHADFVIGLLKVAHVRINSFDGTIDNTSRVTLTWDVSGDPRTLTLSWDGERRPISPQETTTKDPITITTTTTFTLRVEGDLREAPGNVHERNVVVRRPPPSIASFTATWEDGQLKFEWKTEYADHVEICAGGQKLKDPTLPFKPTPVQPLPASFTMKATQGDLSTGLSVTKTLVQRGYEPVPGSPFGRGEMANAWSIAASPDGAGVVVGFGGGLFKVFDAQNFREIGAVRGLPGDCRSIAVSHNPTRYFLGYPPGTLTVLDANLVRQKTVSVRVGLPPCSVAVSREGARVFVADAGRLTLLDAATLQTLDSVDNVCSEVVASPSKDATIFAAGMYSVTAWYGAERLTKVAEVSLRPDYSPIGMIAISPDGARVFVGLEAGMSAVLEAQPLREVRGSPFSIAEYVAAVSHDGTRLFVAREATLTVLDGQTYKPVPGTTVEVGRGAYDIALSPDGARVFVASRDLLALRPIFGAA